MVSHSPESPELPVIGWREWLSFPELGIPGVKAKIDTGARSSALHTHDYEVYATESGESRVRFHLHPLRDREDVELACDAPITGQREVKDSGGHVEMRPFITVLARLGEIEWPIDLSLTNREGMRFRMLLGRTALKRRFVIDTGRSYLRGKSLVKKYPPRP
ncbi:MAG: ATP-dependent zinc protease [Verrucomicrobiae bacterium]|nr:ATP-dependent zinc protease [Verrucomicrobiae bacterium]